MEMLTETSNFLDDSTGIEKSLRLVQGICTVFAGLAATAVEDVAWSTAKSQINLGRRYLRIHKWHPCFRTAYSSFTRDDMGALEKLLEVAKWSFLGLYFLLEMPTITNAMGITSYDWGPHLQIEALKCWFYGISFSLLLGYYQLFMLSSSLPEPSASKAPDEKSAAAKDEKDPSASSSKGRARKEAQDAARSKITTQLAIDHCDLFLPGSAVGWIPAGQVGVGICQSISSVLAMQGVWDRVNGLS